MKREDLPRDNKGKLRSYCDVGGYPIFYLDKENQVLCPDCANKSDSNSDELDNFKPIAAYVNWENPDLYCDQCSRRIESAYAEDREDPPEDMPYGC